MSTKRRRAESDEIAQLQHKRRLTGRDPLPISNVTSANGHSVVPLVPLGEGIGSVAQVCIRSRRGAPSLGDGERFIASRRGENLELRRRKVANAGKTPAFITPMQKEYNRVLLSSLCDVPLDQIGDDGELRRLFSYGSVGTSVKKSGSFLSRARNGTKGPAYNFPYSSKAEYHDVPAVKMTSRWIRNDPFENWDYPEVAKDCPPNLLSWNDDHVIAFASGCKVHILCALTFEQFFLGCDDVPYTVTGVSWCNEPGSHHILAVGCSEMYVNIWDTHTRKVLHSLGGHVGRVSAMAWNGNQLSVGLHNGTIMHVDLRQSRSPISTYAQHSEEVLCMNWDKETQTLASAGQDGRLCLWDSRRSSENFSHRPRQVLEAHAGPMSALDWCPFKRGLLASGGGAADRTIKIWSSATGTMLKTVDTDSGLTSLHWSLHKHELISAHGGPNNQITIWGFPSMTKVKELRCHSDRIISTAVNPNRAVLLTAGADEKLLLWRLHEKPPPISISSVLRERAIDRAPSFNFPSIR